MKQTFRKEKGSFLCLDSYYRELPDMTKPMIAVVTGIAVGFTICIGGQKLWNKYEKAECLDKTGKSLVYMKTFIGDTFHCVSNYATGEFTGP